MSQTSNVTFLCGDIQESTKLISGQDVEQARDWVEKAINLMSHSVNFNGGTIITLTGDGLVASFDGEYHQLRACIAAASLQKLFHSKELPCHARVGLHSTFIASESSDYEMQESKGVAIAELVQKVAPIDGVSLSHPLREALGQLIEVGPSQDIAPPSEAARLATYPLTKISSEAKKQVKSFKQSIKTPLSEAATDELTVIEGERKFVTSVFIKVINKETGKPSFPTPQQMKLAMDAVRHFEGTPLKRGGDSLYAIFGAPVTFEDHPLRGCLAAYELQQRIYDEKLPLAIRVGINTGEVVMDQIGSEEFHQYDAIGASVNLAARMMQTAEENQIQLSEETFKLVEQYIQSQSLSEKKVKGFSKPIRTYNLVGINPDTIRKRMEVMFYGDTPFVGREQEMALLGEKYSQTTQGQGQLVGVSAEPGVGKSRLLFEFAQKGVGENGLLYTMSSSAYESKVAYSTLKELVRRLFGSNRTRINEQQEKKVVEKLEPIAFSEQLAHASILSVLGVERELPEWSGLDVSIQRRILFTTLVEYLCYRSQNRAIVLIIEDVHWCDGESLQFLQNLVSYLEGHKLMVILDYRPEFSYSESFESCGYELVLRPLDDKVSSELISLLLPGEEAIQSLQQKIVAVAEGNPFLVEEYVKMLVANQEVAKNDQGEFEPTEKLRLSDIPLSVQGVVSARIDQLEVEEKSLLRQASILGRVFPLSFLRYISELEEEAFAFTLRQLGDKGFILQSALLPEPTYSFQHANLRDVAYHSLLKKNKYRYHQRLVEQIEEHKQAQLKHYYRILAEHSQAATLWAKALHYYNLYVPSLISLEFPNSDYFAFCPEAVYCFEQLSKEQQKSQFMDYGRLMLLYIHALFTSSQPQKAMETINKLQVESQVHENPSIEAFALGWLLATSSAAGHSTPVLPLVDKVLALAEEIKDTMPKEDAQEVLSGVNTMVAHPLMFLGDYQRLDDAIQVVIDSGLPLDHVNYYSGADSVAVGFGLYLNSLWTRGDIETIKRYLPTIEKKASNLPLTKNSFSILCDSFISNLALGNFSKANEYAISLFKLSNELQTPLLILVTAGFSAINSFYLGMKEEALGFAMKYKMILQKANYFSFMSHSSSVIEILARCGNFEDAWELLNVVQVMGEEDNAKPFMAECYRVRALMTNLTATDHSHDEEIVSLLNKAKTLTDEVGCNRQHPFIELNFAELYQRLGDENKMRQHHQQALDYFQQYGMNGWYDYYQNLLSRHHSS